MAELIFTSDIHEECRRVAAELQQQFPRGDLAAVLDLMLVNAHAFPSTTLEGRVRADADDDKFPVCPVASGAGCIVSRDKHLVDVPGYRGIEVLRPRCLIAGVSSTQDAHANPSAGSAV